MDPLSPKPTTQNSSGISSGGGGGGIGTGRPPWFRIGSSTHDLQQQLECPDAFLIGCAGGSASGKTSVAEMIIKQLDVPWVVLLSMDSFYKALGPEEIAQAHQNNYNFDHPNAFDYDLLLDVLLKLKKGMTVQVPIYDFKTHSRLKDRSKHVYGANVIIFEGIFALWDPRIVELMDLKIFVDTDDDIRLARRLKRDIAERGRDLHGVLQQYNKFVKPSFDEYIRPTMRNADVIVPRGADNVVAIEVITKHIARQLDDRGYSIRSQLKKFAQLSLQDGLGKKQLPDNIVAMPMTQQLKFIHTMIRDASTSRDDFIFFADRLARLVVEAGLSQLPYDDVTIMTPCNAQYKGLKRSLKLCGVSIVRAGVTMERSLRRVCQDITIGKLLIQTDHRTLEPLLHYCKLPPDISERYVLLMDASVGTGAAGMMAVRVLLEHEVEEDRIIFLSLIGAPEGLSVLANMFPKMKIVVSEVDWAGLNDKYYICPGIGNFGDRYFGTE